MKAKTISLILLAQALLAMTSLCTSLLYGGYKSHSNNYIHGPNNYGYGKDNVVIGRDNFYGG